MRRVLFPAALAGLFLLLTCVPSDACPPVAGAVGYSQCAGASYSYAAPVQTYYQQTILAYPVTLLAVPTTTVVAQPAVVPPAAPQPAPVPAPQPQAAPPPQAEVMVQPQATAVAASQVIVQRAVVQNYAVPLAAVVNYSYAYGAGHVNRVREVIVQRNVGHRAAAVVVQRQRRVGPVRALFQRVAANRAQRRVPSSTTVIVR